MKNIFSRFGTVSAATLIILLVSGCNILTVKIKDNFINEDNMLVINKKPTFIIGSYSIPELNDPFKELAANGYNYVRVDANAEQLDAAYKNGLMTWVSIGSIKKETEKKDKKRLSILINKYKNYPALLCWEMEDEPAFTWNSAKPRILPEPLKKTYDFIKKEDPEHLIFTNHSPVNLISTMTKYNSSTDIVGCDVYPVIPHGIKPSYALFKDGLQGDLLNSYISQVGEYVEKMEKVVNKTKPIFMVLQGFSWEMLKPEKERNQDMILYPSFEQIRFMFYDAIVHGANGIVIWGANYTPLDSPFMADLNKATKELNKIQEILSAPNANLKINSEYHETGHSVDRGITILPKKVGNETYLLTVNSDKNPVKVTLSGLEGFISAKVLEEYRNIEIRNGKITESYKPFDVHIYKLRTYEYLASSR